MLPVWEAETARIRSLFAVWAGNRKPEPKSDLGASDCTPQICTFDSALLCSTDTGVGADFLGSGRLGAGAAVLGAVAAGVAALGVGACTPDFGSGFDKSTFVHLVLDIAMMRHSQIRASAEPKATGMGRAEQKCKLHSDPPFSNRFNCTHVCNIMFYLSGC